MSQTEPSDIRQRDHIALNGTYWVAETPRFAAMQFHQFIPAILDAMTRE